MSDSWYDTAQICLNGHVINNTTVVKTALFLNKYEAKYPQATECLEKDPDELLAFYDFPAEHWKHIRTTNPIESTFATVRHRTKGYGDVGPYSQVLLSHTRPWRSQTGREPDASSRIRTSLCHAW